MKFFTVGTEALELDASQNATFASNVNVQGNTIAEGYLQFYGILYARNNIALLNKAGNNWLSVATRDTSGSEAVYNLSNLGSATFAADVSMANGNATGKFAVKSTGVHASYDFYNDGTSYFNGAVIIDHNLDMTSNGVIKMGGTEVISATRGISAGTGTFTGAVTIEGGTLDLGKADTASGHINAKELMTFNIDTDNDDTNRYFAWYKDSSSGSGTELLKIEEDGKATFAGDITAIGGDSHSFLTGNTSNLSTADTTGFRLHQTSYTDGRYTHRFRKKDMSGGVPLYLDFSSGTANVFANLMRFGKYSGESIDVEVNGKLKATHFYGDGSNLTGVTVSNADTVDNLHAASFLRSDADDTATGIISVTKKLHDYDTIPPNQNLLDIGSIKIAGRNDIYGNATKTVISDYVARYVNDNTGDTTIRIYVDDNILVDGDTYMVSVYYENLIGSLSIDFADTTVTGNGTQTGTSSAPKSGRIYGYASRADYTSTYRFVDINLTQGSGHQVTLHSPKVEAGTILTDFVATERTDMLTNSMHVRELIATSDSTFAGDVTMSKGAPLLELSSTSGSSAQIIIGRTADTKARIKAGDALAGDLTFSTGGSRRIQIANGGDITFNNALTGTSATFSGQVAISLYQVLHF